MARKTAQYTVTDNNRDNGKTFLITEMPAKKGDKWAMRLIVGLMNANVDLPEGFELSGMAGIAELGLKTLGKVNYELAELLADELLACVQVIPDVARPDVIRPMIEQDIEEIVTYYKLRWEALKLHVDFSVTADLLKYPQATVQTKGTRNAKMSQTS